MVIESAVDRIVRMLSLCMGLGTTAFMVLGLPGILQQQPYLSPFYSYATYAVFFGLPIVLAILSSRAPVRVLKFIASVHAASGLVFLVAWNFALVPGKIPDGPEPWLMTVVTVSTATGALVLPYVRAWAFMFLICATSAVVRWFNFPGEPNGSIAFQDGVMISLFSAVMLTLIQLALRAGHEQDLASLEAQSAAAKATAAEALERQRTRYHAFTHDDVLATLNSAARDAPGTATVVRESARLALEKMDEFRDDPPRQEHLTALEVDHLLRAAGHHLGFPMEPARMLEGASTLAVPADIGDALAEAFAEAMRNSLRHADWPDDRPVTRRASAIFSGQGIGIVVSDDGRGFVTRRVGPDRLGVRLSILQRLNALPGGVATVRSARGRGTTVTLTWSAEGIAS